MSRRDRGAGVRVLARARRCRLARAGRPSRGGRADWTPFGLISHLPGLSLFRAPARFALLVMLAVSVLAAYAARWWQDRWGLAGRILTALLIPLAVSESFMIGGSPVGRPQPVRFRRSMRTWRRCRRGRWCRCPDIASRTGGGCARTIEYSSTAHWFPIVNGYSRVDPPDHGWIMGHMTPFRASTAPTPCAASASATSSSTPTAIRTARRESSGRALEPGFHAAFPDRRDISVRIARRSIAQSRAVCYPSEFGLDAGAGHGPPLMAGDEARSRALVCVNPP